MSVVLGASDVMSTCERRAGVDVLIYRSIEHLNRLTGGLTGLGSTLSSTSS